MRGGEEKKEVWRVYMKRLYEGVEGFYEGVEGLYEVVEGSSMALCDGRREGKVRFM